MMFKDEKTGEFYQVDMSSQEQLDEAARMGLVYAIMHYIPPDDIKSFWKQARGIDIGTKE